MKEWEDLTRTFCSDVTELEEKRKARAILKDWKEKEKRREEMEVIEAEVKAKVKETEERLNKLRMEDKAKRWENLKWSDLDRVTPKPKAEPKRKPKPKADAKGVDENKRADRKRARSKIEKWREVAFAPERRLEWCETAFQPDDAIVEHINSIYAIYKDVLYAPTDDIKLPRFRRAPTEFPIKCDSIFEAEKYLSDHPAWNACIFMTSFTMYKSDKRKNGIIWRSKQADALLRSESEYASQLQIRAGGMRMGLKHLCLLSKTHYIYLITKRDDKFNIYRWDYADPHGRPGWIKLKIV